jgi:TPR repeat protein
LVPVERYLSAKKRQLILGVALGMCITAAATGAAFKYSNYHRGESTGPVSAAPSPAKSDVKVLPPVSRTETTPSAPAVDVFSVSKTNNGATSKSAPGKPVAASYAYAQSHVQTSDPKASSQLARAPGQPQLSATPRRTNSMSPAQLWNAVQSGNSNAAVALANLYIKGEGVPQNCQQARVLLLVASEKRNAAAIRRLQELDKDTCP